MTRVLGVIARSMVDPEAHRLSESMSTRMGRAPSLTTALGHATQVSPVRMTSSPGPTSRACNAMERAADPCEQATQYLRSTYAAKALLTRLSNVSEALEQPLIAHLPE